MGEVVVVLKEDALEASDIVEGGAEEGARGIDFLTVCVVGTVTADDVERLEDEAWRVEGLVATHAGWILAVFDELLADRADAIEVWDEGWHFGWWRRWCSPEEFMENPVSTSDWEGFDSIGGDGMNAGLGDQTSSHGV